MAFEFADIFFGSHQKREGIPTTADGAVRIYKKVGKIFTTSGFFKKSSDIFFGATSQQVAPKKISVLKTQKPQGFTPKGTKNDRWAKADAGQAGKRESKRLPLSCFFSLVQKFCSQNG